MFNFRKLPLFDRDQTKDTGDVQNFLNSHEGIYFSTSKKFINVFVDKLLFIDPVNLNVTTINSDLLVVDFCFCDKTNNLIVLGKSKNALVCSIYNIRAYNFTLLKKIQLSKNIENIKKTLISKCLGYITTLENKKISFYHINNDYSITKSELTQVEEEDLYENMFLCREDIFIVMKKNSINVYRLIIKDSTISYTFIECIPLEKKYSSKTSGGTPNGGTSNSDNNGEEDPTSDHTSSSNNDNGPPPFHEPVLSTYNEEINVLYICHNVLKLLFVVDLSNRSLEYILLENKVINLFAVKFYLILLTEVRRKFYVNIYVIHEEMKMQVFRGTFNCLITNVLFFNNLLFLIVDEYIHQPEVKVDKFYFYEQLKMKWNAVGEVNHGKNSKSDSISNIFKETESSKSKSFDILKMYNDSINNNSGSSNLMKGDLKYDIFLDRKDEARKDEARRDEASRDEARRDGNNSAEEKHYYSEKLFKLKKLFKNCRNQIKIVLKEKNMNEIVHMFKKKKLFLWLLKFADLNKNYHTINFGHMHHIYADFLFEKEKYELAMHHYINTIGFLETAIVIHKYLNLELYEYLSRYLEKLHQVHLFNDEHTMMLLTCYKKECKKKKIISFIRNNKNKINLQKTYKFLSNVGYYNVVLKFSKKNKDHLTYISILIDKFENYEKSLKYILMLDVENICILLFRYGYKFIKYFPQRTIFLLKRIIKKYNLNLTIFIPLFLDNIDFLFLFILKFLDKKNSKGEERRRIVMEADDPGRDSPPSGQNLSMKQGDDLRRFTHERDSLPPLANDTIANDEAATTANIISNKKIEFDIFNGEYDYILFVTVMQILLQKYKTKEKENHVLTFNIDKLIKNEDKNITFLSAILLSIYNYNKGLLYVSNKMNKHDMSFLFTTQKMVKKFRLIYAKQALHPPLQQIKLHSDNPPLRSYNLMQITDEKFAKKLFNTCMHLMKVKGSMCHNYIFYYLSLLNDDKYLTRFVKTLNKKSSISLLHLINVLRKYNKNYGCVKKLVISYINQMDRNINKKYAQIVRDKRELYKIKKKKASQKYNFHIIDNTYCSICKEMLSVPIIHFLCNHSYHFYCLNGEEDCILCRNKDNEKKLLKEKAKNAINNFDEFFKYLQGSQDKFSFISNYLSYGVTPSK